MSCEITARIEALGLTLPDTPKAQANYAPWAAHPLGNAAHETLVVIAGQTSRRKGVPISGRCLSDADIPVATEAAQVAMLNAIALLRAACDGDLSRVVRLMRLRGFVNAGPDFTQHSIVLNGSSDVLAAAFSHLPAPARTAVGVSGLPAGCWVEVELEAIIRG